jgi:putative tryptophan/tyrosine transport system substrate-binding protein
VRRIGVLMGQAAIDSEGQSRAAALRNVLQDLGWIDDRNVRFELRWFAGEPDRATVYARELVDLAPDVIVANTVPGLAAVARATRTIPTEFVAVTDPVGSGYVAGLAEPGGNITGFSTFDPPIGGKWLEALRQIAPATRKVAVIVDPDFVGFAAIWRAIQAAAPAFGVEVIPAVFRDAADIEPAVTAVAGAPNLALWFPKIPSGADSRDEAESAHHPARCLHSFSCLGRWSPTCSGRGAGLKSRTSFSGISSILL